MARTKFIVLAAFTICAFGFAAMIHGAESSELSAPLRFEGENTDWHGFDRYAFVMGDADLTITPFKVPAEEKTAVGASSKSQRWCIVVVPKQAAPQVRELCPGSQWPRDRIPSCAAICRKTPPLDNLTAGQSRRAAPARLRQPRPHDSRSTRE